MTNADTLFFLYEPGQVKVLLPRLQETDAKIIALDKEVELELKKYEIPFTSIRDVTELPDGQREPLEFTRRLTVEWYASPELDFLSYKGIQLMEQHEGPLLYYFQRTVFYLLLVEAALEHFSPSAVIVPETLQFVPPTADPVGQFSERLPCDVTSFLARQRNLTIEIIPFEQPLWRSKPVVLFKHRATQFVINIGVHLLNACISVLRRPRPVKLLATDPWGRLEPFIQNMPDAEVVMTRRKEIPTMKSWIWRARVRFHDRFAFATRAARKESTQAMEETVKRWDDLGNDPAFSKLFEYHNINFWPVVQPVIDSLVRDYSEEEILTIESARGMFAYHQINCLLLFASNKGYNNVLARVAESLNIPSIELQHAVELTEPTHPFNRFRARYIAGYGEMTKRVYERSLENRGKVVPCGSPRLDAHATPVSMNDLKRARQELRLSKDSHTIFLVAPTIYLNLEHVGFNSYSAWDVLEDYVALQQQGAHQFILKLRAWESRKSFYWRGETQKLLHGQFSVAQYEPIRPLLGIADIVVSVTSTVALEAMIMGKPVVLYVPRAIDRTFDEFEKGGAVLVARSREELFRHVAWLTERPENRTKLVNQANAFLHNNYLLDGASSQRVARLIRKVVVEKRN